MVLIFLISAACTAALFLSPWARRALDAGGRRHGRPWPVVLSQTLLISYFALVGVLGVALLPGLRWAGDLGADLVVTVLFMLTASALALVGGRRLATGPDKTARLLVTIACGIQLVALFSGGANATVLIALGLLGGIALPLWVAPSARTWFGERPLSLEV